MIQSASEMRTAQPGPLAGLLRFARADASEIVFRRGRGGLVYDDRGVPYYDFILGMGPVSIGHANAAFNRRMQEALEDGLMFPGLADVHERYCCELEQAMPGAAVVAFLKTGSEAVSAALRIAAIETGGKGVIRCGYAGWHDALLAFSPNWNEPISSRLRDHIRFETNLRGVGAEEPVANWVDLELDSLQRLIQSRRFGALVLDTYQISQTSMPVVLEAVDACRRSGIVVVLDETKTAGRRGCAGAFVETPLRGDLTVLGKAIGNGFPISVLLQHRSFDAAVRSTRIGGTFSKDALAIRAALATAELMRQTDGYATLSSTGLRVVDLLNRAARACGADADVSALPLLDGRLFEFRYSRRIECDTRARRMLEDAFRENGILLFEGHCSFVCVDHRDLDWDALAGAAHAALHAWRSKEARRET